jgi:hypothetical protein
MTTRPMLGSRRSPLTLGRWMFTMSQVISRCAVTVVSFGKLPLAVVAQVCAIQCIFVFRATPHGSHVCTRRAIDVSRKPLFSRRMLRFPDRRLSRGMLQ